MLLQQRKGSVVLASEELLMPVVGAPGNSGIATPMSPEAFTSRDRVSAYLQTQSEAFGKTVWGSMFGNVVQLVQSAVAATVADLSSKVTQLETGVEDFIEDVKNVKDPPGIYSAEVGGAQESDGAIWLNFSTYFYVQGCL